MSSLPLQRCLERARKEGYEVAKVEQYIPFPKPWGHRVDYMGLFDAIAFKDDPPDEIGIQACADCDVSKHVEKIMSDPELVRRLNRWKKRGNRAVIWGWGKKGARGEAKHWVCREVVL